MYSKLWDLKNSIVEPLLLCGNRPRADFLGGRLGLSIWWRRSSRTTLPCSQRWSPRSALLVHGGRTRRRLRRIQHDVKRHLCRDSKFHSQLTRPQLGTCHLARRAPRTVLWRNGCVRTVHYLDGVRTLACMHYKAKDSKPSQMHRRLEPRIRRVSRLDSLRHQPYYLTHWI